jgi:hypothetical protein
VAGEIAFPASAVAAAGPHRIEAPRQRRLNASDADGFILNFTRTFRFAERHACGMFGLNEARQAGGESPREPGERIGKNLIFDLIFLL